MAIRSRGRRAFFAATVAEQRIAETPDASTIYEIVLRDTGTDRDEIVLRTPWRGVLAMFPPGARVDVGMEKQ